MKIGVFIADDHAVLRTGLRMLIDSQPDMRVVGEAEDGAEAARKATEAKPDVLLMDLAMPGQDGLEAIPAVLKTCFTTS
jgi:YesN/AraC family two-component response regulator